MTSHDEQRLSDALRRQAASQDPHLLTLDDVTSRAGSIRRRRVAAGAVAAAAVVAIVVPTAMLATDRRTDSTPPPATSTPTATPTGGATPTAKDPVTPNGKPVRVAIDGDLPRGAAPAVPVVVQGMVIAPDGSKVDFGADVPYFAPVGDGYAAIVRQEGTDAGRFEVRGGDGSVLSSAPALVSGLAVTRDHSAVAYVGTDQKIHTWSASDGDLVFSDKLPDVILAGMANTQEGTCKEPVPEGPGCTVFFSKGAGGAGYAESHGITDDIPGWTKLNDVNDLVVAGQTKSLPEGSCNKVEDESAPRVIWQTCKASPIDLSPSNAYVTALPAYYEGLCCSTYSVYDVAAGAKVLDVEVRADADRMGYVPVMGWEDDGHVLAGAYTQGGWRLVRVGLDGTAELADVGELPSTDIGEVPVHLPVG